VIQRAYGTALEMAEWLWSSGGQFLDVRGHIQEGLQVLTQAAKAADLLGDKTREERLLGQLGRAWMALRNWRTAAEYFEQALTIAKKIGDQQGEASHLGNLGQLQLQQENPLKAADYFQDAMRIATEIPDPQIVGRLRASLGLVKLRNQQLIGYTLERMIEAIELFKSAVTVARETGDRRGEASHLGCIGGAYELMASRNLSLPPFVWGSPYPGEDADRYERYKKQLERADQESYLEAYEYYSDALSVASEIGDEQAQEKLHGDRHRVGSKASLPLCSSGDVNYNIWSRNASYTGYVPGTRHMRR
jgi:tetratricopeptide (TPR) repeat protein